MCGRTNSGLFSLGFSFCRAVRIWFWVFLVKFCVAAQILGLTGVFSWLFYGVVFALGFFE